MNAISRRLASLRCLSALTLAFVLQSASAQQQRYVVLEVTPATGELSQAFPAINDWGEIVYEEFCNCPNSTLHLLVSTKRGTLVDLWPNGRSPDINKWGEVVYADDFVGDGTPGSRGFNIYSTERGRLAPGNTPVIDNFGYVAATGVGEQRFDMGVIRPDLTISEMRPLERDPGGAPLENFKDKEVLYVGTNQTGNQLYSTRRGQISNLGADVVSIAVNDIGKYVYSQYNVIYSQSGDVLYTAPGPQPGAGSLDMNLFGDIVFVETTDRPITPKSRLLLLTKRPHHYERNYGFTPK